MDKEPHERLKEARKKHGFVTARDAARYFAWQEDTYASHENGNRKITPEYAIKYGSAYHFSLDWLYRGVSDDKKSGVGVIPYVAQARLPRLDWNFMENHGGIEKAMERATEFSSLPQHMRVKLPAFVLPVIGDSMRNWPGASPSFEEGDELVFSTSETVTPGDFVLAEILDEKLVVFRRYLEKSKTPDGFIIYELAPLNPAYRTYLIDKPERARIVARMTHCIKSY